MDAATAKPWTLLVGGALEHLRDLPADSVQTSVCSPPYFQLRSYSPEQLILDPALSPKKKAKVLAELERLGIKPE